MLKLKVLFRGVTLPPDPISIVVDYCEGGSLWSLLFSQQPISAAEKICFIKDIAQGMYHLHTSMADCAVIHRDLAARNILVNIQMSRS